MNQRGALQAQSGDNTWEGKIVLSGTATVNQHLETMPGGDEAVIASLTPARIAKGRRRKTNVA